MVHTARLGNWRRKINGGGGGGGGGDEGKDGIQNGGNWNSLFSSSNLSISNSVDLNSTERLGGKHFDWSKRCMEECIENS